MKKGRAPRALVMGLGRFGGGEAVTRHLARSGYRVSLTDLQSPAELAEPLARLKDLPLELVLGTHAGLAVESFDLVVANPAVRRNHPLLEEARAKGVRITSEIELLVDGLSARLVAVTGTQGKSSTVHFLHQLLLASDRRAHLGGNIGGSLLPERRGIQPDDVVVLELSSYQLEAWHRPAARSFEAAAITNVLADHLERHGSPAAYRRAKARIVELVQPGGAVLSPPEVTEDTLRLPADVEGIRFGPGQTLRIEDGRFRGGDEDWGRCADLSSLGAFQRTNVLLAMGLARQLGVGPEALQRALPELRGLPHRLEDLGRIAERRVIDNGVSTTPDSTAAALRALERCHCLLVGGQLKEGLDLDPLIVAARAAGSLAIAFGADGPALARALESGGVRVETVDSVPEAVQLAFERTAADETILFSPAAASFDAYPNFLERVRDFRRALEPSSPVSR